MSCLIDNSRTSKNYLFFIFYLSCIICMYVHNCFSFLQNGYCSFALRISSWARWTLYSLWRSHVLSHPLTSCQPEWSQVIHFFHLSFSLISQTINLETNKVYRILFIGRNEKYVAIFLFFYCLCLQFG